MGGELGEDLRGGFGPPDALEIGLHAFRSRGLEEGDDVHLEHHRLVGVWQRVVHDAAVFLESGGGGVHGERLQDATEDAALDLHRVGIGDVELALARGAASVGAALVDQAFGVAGLELAKRVCGEAEPLGEKLDVEAVELFGGQLLGTRLGTQHAPQRPRSRTCTDPDPNAHGSLEISEPASESGLFTLPSVHMESCVTLAESTSADMGTRPTKHRPPINDTKVSAQRPRRGFGASSSSS